MSLKSEEKEVVSCKVITGTSRSDKLKGNHSNQTFDGKGDDDIIDGGRGIDKVLIFDNAQYFKMVTFAGTTKVTGEFGSQPIYRGDTITITNIEKIQFVYKTISLSALEK